jgi:hypothetical protein
MVSGHGDEVMKHREVLGSGTVLYDTIVLDTRHYALVKTAQLLHH